MKTNRFYPKRGTLAMLASLLLTGVTLQAQTFKGHQTLTDSPASFEAAVYPLTNVPTTIKVIFNNPTGGSIRVLIRNQEGKVFYDESEVITQYRRRFDLSPLPEGSYTVELSKRNEHYSQAFAINPPTQVQSQIALLDPPFPKKINAQTNKKLIVSQ